MSDAAGLAGEKHAPDAPGNTVHASPAGMTLTFPTEEKEAVVPETVNEDSTQGETDEAEGGQGNKKPDKESDKPDNKAKQSTRFGLPAGPVSKKHFRQQFDQLMKRLEDRFQSERVEMEEKHSKELEEAMGYFSLSSEEREAKQQELQVSLLEDIGNMAQQLHDLTGALGPNDDLENLTLPSDPQVLEQYASRMQELEGQFQKEKVELERKHAAEMEEALGTLKLSREQRDTKKMELQDQLSAEIGDMAKQLEELNRAKKDYESKMAMLKQQLTEKDKPRAHDDPNLDAISRRLHEVERERDSAHDELRRLRLALQVTHGNVNSLGQPDLGGNIKSGQQPHESMALQHKPSVTESYGISPQERENVTSLRGRIEQVERELKEAAQTSDSIERMKNLRKRMEYIEKDLWAAEQSTKEQYALDNIRARMEKVESLLTEGEKAAHDWEALEELGQNIDRVDNDLLAVEEAKKEYEALQTLRTKMEEVEAELKAAEQLASNRENVERLRERLGQVEKELGVAKPSQDDNASIEKLLSRLNKAETSLEAARKSTPKLRGAPTGLYSTERVRDPEMVERDDEVENILARLAQAERKLQAAKNSAYRQNPQGYNPHDGTSDRQAAAAPFDEHQSKLRARLQDHLDDSDPNRRTPPSDNRSDPRRFEAARERTAKLPLNPSFEEPRPKGGYSSDRYYVQDGPHPMPRKTDNEASPWWKKREQDKGVNELEEKLGTDLHGATSRPLRRRRGGFPEDQRLRPTKSMPYTTIPESEDKHYDAGLQELRRQRAMLSARLPKKGEDEKGEEKKEDEGKQPEAKYSFREAIRNEERQRLRERLHPQDRSKSKPSAREPVPTSVPPLSTDEPPVSTGEPPASTDKPPVSTVVTSKSDGSKGDPPSETRSVRSTSTEDAPGEKSKGTERNVPLPINDFNTDRESADPPGSEAASADETSTYEASNKVKQPTSFDKEEAESSESEPASIHAETVKYVGSDPSPDTPVRRMPEPEKRNIDESPMRAEAAPTAESGQRPYIQHTTVTSSKETRQALRDKDRTMRLFVYLMFLILVILAIVIVVVVLLYRDDDNGTRASIEPGSTPSPRPTGAPSVPPTAAPTLPLNAPTSPNVPTFPTTGTIPPGSLNGCPELADDRPLLLDGVTRERSTQGSMYDASRIGNCGPIDEVGDDGVWYVLVGAGELVQMNTCTIFNPNFNTQLLVYQQVRPESGCSQGLSCVVANDDFCGLQSSVSFFGETGRLYFVYISGRSANSVSGDPTEGDFSLTLSTTPRGTCAGAIGPLEIQPNRSGQLPVIMEGTLMGGTFGVNPCNPGVATRTGEVWYSIVGNGETVVASTCHSITDFPARLAIYTGASCDNLDCETAEDQDCGNGSEITWLAEQDEEYYLRVYSPEFIPDVKFGLTLREA